MHPILNHLPTLGLVAATADGLTGLADDFANFLQGLGVPGGTIAFTIVGLVALTTAASGSVNAKKVAGAMLGVLVIVAFIAAGDGAIREADDIGTDDRRGGPTTAARSRHRTRPENVS